jgi:hypothetical protein
MARGVKQGAECSAEGCRTKPYGRGLCMKHWSRLRRNGSPDGTKTPTLGLSPWGKVEFYGWTESPSGCWVFDGPKNED